MRERHAREYMSFMITQQAKCAEHAALNIKRDIAASESKDEVDSWFPKHPGLYTDRTKTYVTKAVDQFGELSLRLKVP